jgi:hypothetical protein
VGTLEQENAKLELLRQHFASDDLLLERAAVFRDLSPAQCLAETIESCRDAMVMLSYQDAATRARSLADEPLPADTLAILEALQKC